MDSVKTTLFIAYKSIVRGRRATFGLMVLILSLSFFNMMFIPGVFSGLLKTILAAEVDTSTAHIVISPQQEPIPKSFIGDQRRLRSQIETIPGVVGTVRMYLTAGAVSFDKEHNGVFKRVSAQVIGIDPSESKRVLILSRFMVAGEFLSDEDTDQIILPAALAGGYGLPAPTDLGGVHVGDKVQIVYGNGVSRQYRVKGISNIVFGPALTNTYITAKEAESVLSASDQASQILVKVNDTTKLDYFKSRIETMTPGLRVQSFMDLLTAIQPLLDAFTVIAIIVSVISVLVAAITIFVMIYINAVNKRRQIGILKAIGIKESIIVYSYVIQSLFYVFCSVSIGLVFVFFVLNPLLALYPIKLPFGGLELSFSRNLIIESIAGMVAAGFIAGLVPARIVARENIIKAIWG